MKYFKVIIIIAATLFIVAVILYQTGTFSGRQIAPGNVAAEKEQFSGRIVPLVKQEIPLIYKTVGTVRSRDEVELSPRIVARVIEVTRRSGDSVKKGELLVKLDDSDLQAACRRAQESLKSAEASLTRALSEYNRQKLLLEKNVIPRKTFELAEEGWKAAVASEESARQGVKVADANLSYSEIKSPMDGIVSDRFKDPGDLASPGNIMMKVFDPSRLMLYVPLRESLVKSVKIGDKIKFTVESLKKTFTGEVREIVPSVDPGSRTFLIKMCILNPSKDLMPGMFGMIELQLGTETAYIVPSSAIKRIGQLEYITVLNDNDVPSQVLVRTIPGPTLETLKVVSGIDADARLVVSSQ
ncbi:MAG: efflux RND transporter periplasmic adaptor subunit [Victivallaceae bacterium]